MSTQHEPPGSGSAPAAGPGASAAPPAAEMPVGEAPRAAPPPPLAHPPTASPPPPAPPAELSRLLAAALWSANEAISITAVDAGGRRVAFVNPAFSALTGYGAEEVVGQPTPYPTSETDQALLEGLRAELLAGRRVEGEIVAWRKDGSKLWVACRAAPIRDPDGSVTHWVSSHRDVTARRQSQDAAEQASLAKSLFLSRISHELLTPLNSLIGFPELLLDGHFGPLDDAQHRAVANILVAGEQLRGLLHDLLDLARIEAGRLELERSCFDLGGLLADLSGPVTEAARRKGLTLEVEVAPDLPRVDGDPKRLKQVALNLLDNAVKYTSAGGRVKLMAWPARSAAGAPLVRLAVADSGIGIRSEDHARIFSLFEQVDPSLTRRQSGTGLGLALVKRLLDMHGGRAWVESAGEGLGSTFHVEIPGLPYARGGEAEPGPEPPRGGP
jgi:PAS domain S-box-containing protein